MTIGSLISCLVTVTLVNPVTKEYHDEKMLVICKIIDAPNGVGTEGEEIYPLILDCEKELKWLSKARDYSHYLTSLEACNGN